MDVAISLACPWERSGPQADYLVTVVQSLNTSVPIDATVGWHLSWGHCICLCTVLWGLRPITARWPVARIGGELNH